VLVALLTVTHDRYALAFGDGNGFIGRNGFLVDGPTIGTYFVVQACFMSTSATIISGGMAERTNLWGYLIVIFVHSTWVYPVYAHWVWGPGGWLKELGFVDHAGSSVVHLLGGTATLLGAIFLGPRIGRFDGAGNVLPIPGHSTVIFSLGAWIIAACFFPFNVVSTYDFTNAQATNIIMMNTAVSSMTALMTTSLYMKLRRKRWSLLMCLNGLLGGMVAICAGCATMRVWAAFLTGIGAGLVVIGGATMLLGARIDDPIDAAAVHLGCGAWGTLAAGIMKQEDSLFKGGDIRQVGVQLLGIVVGIAWTAFFHIIALYIAQRLQLLRVSEKTELEGLDAYTQDEPSYPEFTRMEGEIEANKELMRDVRFAIEEMENMRNRGVQLQSPVPAFSRSTAERAPTLGGLSRSDAHESSLAGGTNSDQVSLTHSNV
jgi:ammonium transporter, Amt family